MKQIGRGLRRISVYNTGELVLESCLGEMELGKFGEEFGREMNILRNTAAQNQLVALAANQIRMRHRVFAILK